MPAGKRPPETQINGIEYDHLKKWILYVNNFACTNKWFACTPMGFPCTCKWFACTNKSFACTQKILLASRDLVPV